MFAKDAMLVLGLFCMVYKLTFLIYVVSDSSAGTAGRPPAGPVTQVNKLFKILVLRSGGLRIFSVANMFVTGDH